MEYSRAEIKDAITWGGSSTDGDPDSFFEVLEQADPKLVAKVRAEVSLENRALSDATRASRRTPTVARRCSKEDQLAEERRFIRSLPFNFPW